MNALERHTPQIQSMQIHIDPKIPYGSITVTSIDIQNENENMNFSTTSQRLDQHDKRSRPASTTSDHTTSSNTSQPRIVSNLKSKKNSTKKNT